MRPWLLQAAETTAERVEELRSRFARGNARWLPPAPHRGTDVVPGNAGQSETERRAMAADESTVSTLGGAILGLLATKPRTGYELAQAMRTPIGYMWTARHSQIYTELARLQAAKLVEGHVVDGPGPRDTKRYTITRRGRLSLITWTDSPLTEVTRSELLLRVRCLWLLPPDRARRFLETQRRAYEESLEKYAWEEADFARLGQAVEDQRSPYFAQYATLQYGLMQARGTLEWFDWLLDRLPRVARTEPTTTEAAPGSGR